MNDTPQRTGLKGFLRENWLYIVGPCVVVLIGLILLAVFGGDGNGGFFGYNLW